MAKQIIRLTESDLHRMIKRAVNKIVESKNRARQNWLIREEDSDLEAQFEEAKKKMKALKGVRGKKDEFLAAAQEYQRLKELMGKTNMVLNPSAYQSDIENEKRGIAKVNGNTGWRKMGHLVKKKETEMDDREGLNGVAINDVDAIMGS